MWASHGTIHVNLSLATETKDGCHGHRIHPVPPLYLIQATNGSFAVAGDALFAAKEARCFPESAFGFVCLPSATLSARQEVRRVHGDPSGDFVATREPSYGSQRCSGGEPLVPVMVEPGGHCHVWTPPVL